MWNSTGLGTLGRMAIYKATANPYGLAVADSHVTVIRPFKQFVLPEYLYFYFSNPTVQSVISIIGLEPGATANNLLELSHGIDIVIQNDKPTGFAVHARCH